jgi:hypothetical protein
MADVSLLFDDYIERYGPSEGRRRALRDATSAQAASESGSEAPTKDRGF